MQIFNALESGKYSDENPTDDSSEIADDGYVRTKIINDDSCSVSVAAFRDGEVRAKPHWHPNAAEIYYVLEGKGVATDSNGNKKNVESGDVIYFSAGETHNMHAAPGHDCKYYRVQAGQDRHVED
jgi:quercetin dioxygenase-like cupin family protein